MSVTHRAPGRRRQVFSLVLGAAIATLLVATGLVSIAWTPYAVASADPGLALQGPSAARWLGTDTLGRDVLSLTMKGALATLAIPFAGLVVAALIGVPVGLVAARWARIGGGFSISAYAVLLQVVLVALLLATAMGPSAVIEAAAIAIASILPLAMAVREALAAVQGRFYIEAARLAGLSRWEALRAHALREIVTDVAIAGCRLIATGIAAEATISFLGIGMQAPGVTLGLLLHDAQGYGSSNPLPTIAIGLVLVATLGGFNLLATGLSTAEKMRDAAA